jgi:hypothetical protein
MVVTGEKHVDAEKVANWFKELNLFDGAPWTATCL